MIFLFYEFTHTQGLEKAPTTKDFIYVLEAI